MANNYRAALDHLAWALVVRGRTPPGTLTRGSQRAIVFPIYEGRQEFNDALGRKLPGARRTDVAKVRKEQPYHYADRNRIRHALTLLSRINNWDKHRTTEPIWAYPARVDIEVTDVRDCSSRRLGFLRRPGPVEPGRELAFIRARKTGPSPAIQVNIRVTPEPCLDSSVGVTHWVNLSAC